VEPHADAVRAARATLPPGGNVRVVFTAHSIPTSMARTAGPDGGRYEAQLNETAGLVSAAGAPDLPWDLVWQSRSGPPHVPWLEPDVNDHLVALAGDGVTGVVVSPIGFVSDHLEVIWDLDNEAASTAKRLGLDYARAATPGTDRRFVAMVHDLVRERVNASDSVPRSRLGTVPLWDTCPVGCCPPPRRGSGS
jgi:ferrochelatase